VEATLQEIARHIALAIEVVAIAIIAWGAVEALIGIVRLGVGSGATDHARRAIWLDFARWLVAGLTFQLAADVVNTSFAPTWDELGHLAAIAVIRTFLSYFLDRELRETGERQREESESAVAQLQSRKAQ
jgi:uncharacterized membrane protein